MKESARLLAKPASADVSPLRSQYHSILGGQCDHQHHASKQHRQQQALLTLAVALRRQLAIPPGREIQNAGEERPDGERLILKQLEDGRRGAQGQVDVAEHGGDDEAETSQTEPLLPELETDDDHRQALDTQRDSQPRAVQA